VPVVIDWLHVLAVSTWIGGLFTIGMLFPRAVGAASKGEAGDELSIAATRFSHIAICCTALFLATGWLNARLQVASLAPLLSTWYGRTLLIKLWLLALALFAAARNRYWLLPRLVRDPGATATPSEARLEQTGDLRATRASRHACPDVQERFLRAVRLEWVLAVGILACSALLTQLQPARHIRRHEHREPHPVHRPTGATPELAVARPAMRAISLPPTMASALGGAVVHRRSPGRMSHHE
jgi:putative copper export protein